MMKNKIDIIEKLKKDFGKNVLVNRKGQISILIPSSTYDYSNFLFLRYTYKKYFNIDLTETLETSNNKCFWRINVHGQI